MPSRLVAALARMLRPSRAATSPPASAPTRLPPTATVQVTPPAADALTITYAPQPDGEPDAGEVVWTWVPYDENDGRGKDRPVLVIARQSEERVYAVRLTSHAHDGSRDYLALGPGEWDSRGRPSWLDLSAVYSVHDRGMRREAAALDRARFDRVAAALTQRYGLRRAD